MPQVSQASLQALPFPKNVVSDATMECRRLPAFNRHYVYQIATSSFTPHRTPSRLWTSRTTCGVGVEAWVLGHPRTPRQPTSNPLAHDAKVVVSESDVAIARKSPKTCWHQAAARAAAWSMCSSISAIEPPSRPGRRAPSAASSGRRFARSARLPAQTFRWPTKSADHDDETRDYEGTSSMTCDPLEA